MPQVDYRHFSGITIRFTAFLTAGKLGIRIPAVCFLEYEKVKSGILWRPPGRFGSYLGVGCWDRVIPTSETDYALSTTILKTFNAIALL